MKSEQDTRSRRQGRAPRAGESFEALEAFGNGARGIG